MTFEIEMSGEERGRVADTAWRFGGNADVLLLAVIMKDLASSGCAALPEAQPSC